ncbi:MAG: hypothetical protein QM722_09805 [Piscinibacter sp.]
MDAAVSSRVGRMPRVMHLVALLLLLLPAASGCGGGGGDDTPSYALSIDGPAQVDTTAASVVMSGNGFLPPGSTCSGECAWPIPAPVFGQLGAYTLSWANAATSGSGSMQLAWICNCGGSAPYWLQSVPLAVGVNRIEVTQTAGSRREQAVVTITRR